MNYAALIENRKSVRAFESREVPASSLGEIRAYYEKSCHRLVPEIATELVILDTVSGQDLVGTAGYEETLVGAPHYLVLLTEDRPLAGENAGYMMEDLVLKLCDMDLQTCWITFADGETVKAALGLQSPLKIAAIAAFGYGRKTQKKLRLNILSMSNVDIYAQRSYYSQKKDVSELVFVDRLDNIRGLDERIGFYEDMLWQSFYSASKAPSLLNRQPYAFLLKDNDLFLVRLPDPYTDAWSEQLGLGIVLLHFSAVAEQWVGTLPWNFENFGELELPQNCRPVAVYHM